MRLSWISKIFFFLNILVGTALVITNFSSKFEPVSNPYGYLFSLTYPIFLVLNIGFVLHWMYQKKIHFLFSLILILFGYSNVSKLVAFNWKDNIATTADFKIMTFNVRLLNQYHSLNEENIDNQIFEYIESENPDIIAFQEFVDSKVLDLNYVKRMKSLGYKYTQREPNQRKKSKLNFFGLQTFSKFKIKKSGLAYRFADKSKARSYYTDIEIQSQIVRVYNTHLNSLGFISEDYQFVENITQNSETEAIEKSKNILNKVIRAARKRQTEVEEIAKHIAACPYPVIVLGDFNEPPYSFAYPRFATDLEDPFQKFGFGVGTTFDGISTLPGLRLDYILHSPELKAISYKTGQKNLSDHRPVCSQFMLPQ